MMKIQRIYDKVVNHLRNQGKRCADEITGSCKYRLETGNRQKVLKCAAGCLIPKRDYNPQFEGFSVQFPTSAYDEGVLVSNYFNNKFNKGKDGERKIRLIKDLQSVHDSSYNWEDNRAGLERKFEEIANNYGLTYTPPAVK